MARTPVHILEVIFIVFIVLSCKETGREAQSSDRLFRHHHTIPFTNTLTPTVDLSPFDYVYFQNGGGVAILDLDMDGLEDVFLTSNQEADRLYRNLGDFQFEDVTAAAFREYSEESPQTTWSTGVSITDVNADGYPDIYVCKGGPIKRGVLTENRLYVNNGDMTFSEKGKEYGLNDANSSTQATFFDYDRDGDLDCFVLNHSPQFGNPSVAYQLDRFPQGVRPHSCTFYVNEGNGYREATEEVGLVGFSYGLGVVASDLNEDGWTDLYVAQDFSKPDKMYMNDGKGAFSDKLKESVGHISQFSMGCDAADVDNDGLLDISVVDMAPDDHYRSKTMMPSMSREDFETYTEEYGYAPQYMQNVLQIARGNGHYSEVAQMAGVSKTDWSWSTLLADFDNDGMKDQVVTNGYRYNRMQNDFAIEFEAMMQDHARNPSPEIRSQWIDRPPSYKLQNRAFRNQGDLTFEDVSTEWGMDSASFSNGAAYADLDNDGDLDLIINNIDEPASVYENMSSGHYLQVAFERNGRPDLNRSLNARVAIHTNGGSQLLEQTLSRGFQSSSTGVLHFGLGKVEVVDSICIRFSNGATRTLKDVDGDQRIIIDLPY